MNILKISLSALAGFVLGIVLVHTPAVKAQEPGKVLVFIHPVLLLDQKMPVDKVIPGSRVDGISCIPAPVKRLPDAAVCYVATTN
jgi:hypothetical protein